jgi:hypothetical protein
MADEKHEEKREDYGKVIKEKSMEEFAKRMKGKPTPTQDELDRINLGERVELEADGSDPDENAMSAEARHRKQSEAKPATGGGYQTRQATPAAARPKTE